jgi:cation efflux system protein involved in nickel and cobalt tolerance
MRAMSAIVIAMQQGNGLRKVNQSEAKRLTKALPPRFFNKWSVLLIAASLLLPIGIRLRQSEPHSHTHETSFGHIPNLVMSGGDPYIRALMRTISASESNAKDPYVLLYGGKHVHDLAQHPDICISIRVGINRGNCSTAAGRYQFITSTWTEKASLYHPNPTYEAGSITYSFEPEYQDSVTYRWLKDEQEWSVSIPVLLKQGEITEVLKLLSGTWTSLGFGIEDNSMTPYLAEVYQRVLAEELQGAQLYSINR